MTAISDLLTLRGEAQKLKIDMPRHRNVSELEWDHLHEYRSAVRRTASALLVDLQKPNISEERAAAIETASDIACALLDEIDAEFEARDKAGTKEPVIQSRRPGWQPGISDLPDSGDYRSGARPSAEWRDARGNEVRVLAPSDRLAPDRRGGLELGHMLRALVMGAKSPAEERALAEGSGGSGGYTVPTPLLLPFIDSLRARMVVVKAGARTVPMDANTLSIVRSAGDPTAAWRAEAGAVAEGDQTFERVQFNAKSLAVYVKMSRELFDDTVNAVQALENALAQGIAVQFDQACLYGSGSSNQPTGLVNISGTGSTSMGTNGAQLANFDPLIDSTYELLRKNAGDPTAHIMHPRTQVGLAKLKDTQGRYLSPPEMVAKVPMLTTTGVPINETQGTASTASSIITGDFTQMMIGMRQELRIELYREPLATNLQYIFLAHMRADVQVAHPESFNRLKGILP